MVEIRTYDNQLPGFPKEIGQLEQLQELDLKGGFSLARKKVSFKNFVFSFYGSAGRLQFLARFFSCLPKVAFRAWSSSWFVIKYSIDLVIPLEPVN